MKAGAARGGRGEEPRERVDGVLYACPAHRAEALPASEVGRGVLRARAGVARAPPRGCGRGGCAGIIRWPSGAAPCSKACARTSSTWSRSSGRGPATGPHARAAARRVGRGPRGSRPTA
ncbi:hypothetical protein GTY77_04665 [Streptomyces sp. SID8380]|nr:hypothetical protein [Streptomyces sp. SID8380]